MNAYYDKTRENNSNNDILRAYLLGNAAPAPTWKRHADSLLAFFIALVSVLTSAAARRIYRVLSVALLLLSLICVIGAVESGALGLGSGFLFGAILLALEYLTLRKL